MNTVTLTFDCDHTHEGRPIKRGEIREIEAHHADWLIAHRVAHPTPSTTSRGGKVSRDTTAEDQDHAD